MSHLERFFSRPRPPIEFPVADGVGLTRMAAFATAMSPLQTLRRHRQRIGARHAALLAVAWLASAGYSPSANAAPGVVPQGSRPDQVLWKNSRGQVNTIVGTVSENSLTQVAVDTGSNQRKIESLSVVRVTFGVVPQAYSDAVAYLDRNDFANASAKYSLAAGDTTARPVVRARARLAAAETWLRLGGSDGAAITKALGECELFLSEHPDNRDVPNARLLLGRLQRLSGDAAAAAGTYATLYAEGSGDSPSPGYPPEVSFRAGLAAGEAYLASADAAKARELFLGLDGAIGRALASLSENDPQRVDYTSIQTEARLGEGFCLLATGGVSQAKTFFQGQVTNSEGNPARRFGAQLGLGQALLAEGNARAAQLEFAQVSAIDHTSKDRSARALVGLAESAIALQSKNDAKVWLEAVSNRYGDTPAMLKATELQKSL